MTWIVERILERLFLKCALHMGWKKEAEMDLAQVESQADLLRRAKALEEENVPGFEELAATLRKRAAEMQARAPGADVLKVAEELQCGGLGAGANRKVSGCPSSQKGNRATLPAPGTKKRGRPRKHPLPDPAEEQSAEL